MTNRFKEGDRVIFCYLDNRDGTPFTPRSTGTVVGVKGDKVRISPDYPRSMPQKEVKELILKGVEESGLWYTL